MKKNILKIIAACLSLSTLVGCGAGFDDNTGSESFSETLELNSESGKETQKQPNQNQTQDDEPEGPRKTPIMGWASWNAYHPRISEDIILSQAEKLVEYGLDDLGYVYVNVDDGWQNGRGSDGYVKVHAERFPSGMKSLSTKLHSMGLKAGIYSDAGANTCAAMYSGEGQNTTVGLTAMRKRISTVILLIGITIS